MVCPICKIDLEESLFHNTDVNYCPKCYGIWFEEDELRQAKDEKDKELQWLDTDLWADPKKLKILHGIRFCPACRLPLYEVYYGNSGIIVDICTVCSGVWLDRGEFKKIIKYLQEKSNYEILHNYVLDLLKEGFEVFIGPETFKEEVSDFLALFKVLNYKFTTQHPHIAQGILSLPK